MMCTDALSEVCTVNEVCTDAVNEVFTNVVSSCCSGE